jgi:RNA polymerase sigma factor (sigma-70 family)
VSDEALLAGMAAGDPQAATAFVRRYQSRVYGLALAVVGGAASADDVAQEAFVRAWRFAGGYDARRGTVLSWLLTIARNAAIDAVRLRRDQPYDPEVLLAMLTTGESTEDGQIEQIADTERIRIALRRLPREQATAVVLATFYGLTAREIAERQGVPLGTAKTRIRLGLARLRDHFEVSDDRTA